MRRTLAVCVPEPSTQVTLTSCPGWVACITFPSWTAVPVAWPSMLVMADPAVIPAPAAGVPSTAWTTRAPSPAFRPRRGSRGVEVADLDAEQTREPQDDVSGLLARLDAMDDRQGVVDDDGVAGGRRPGDRGGPRCRRDHP